VKSKAFAFGESRLTAGCGISFADVFKYIGKADTLTRPSWADFTRPSGRISSARKGRFHPP
jgi:hypothetical protein